MAGLFPMSARRDGMWLGAGDFAAEQRERLVRRRLHDALVHGAGTVWGLSASACEPDNIRLRTRIIVRPGLAIDALDRELYVDREQCLDVSGLVRHPIWAEMRSPEGATSRTARRAYIVLRYDLPIAAPRVPAGASRGASGASVWDTEPDAAEAFRLELSSAPPPETSELRRHRLAASAVETSLADPFLALALGSASSGAALPSRGDEESIPLLLATVDLDVTGHGVSAIAFAIPPTASRPNPDNRVRAMIPGTRRVAEVLFGERLPARRLPASRRSVVAAEENAVSSRSCPRAG